MVIDLYHLYEVMSDSSSDSYSCAGNSGSESEERLADLSSTPKTTVTFSFRCTCGHRNIMDTSKECACFKKQQ